MAGIYIHIPFCKQACYYCDFYFSTSIKNKSGLVNAIIKEIELQKNYLSGEAISTIYFGGGTPSLLSENELNSIVETIHKYHSVEKNAEITLEANPDDLSIEKLLQLKLATINRLSIGIQSFFDEDLIFMNRAHNTNEAITCVKKSQDAGFSNITIDLIYGIQTLTNEKWIKNLHNAFALNVNHISAYCLTIEPNTTLAHFVKTGRIKNVDEQKNAEQFEIMLEAMQLNNFVQYEISNFCKNENFSKHNSNYWLKKKYLGLGPSAHSFSGTSRQWNVSNNGVYIKSLNENKLHFEFENLTLMQQYNEYILTSIRTIWGADLNYIQNHFGNDFLDYLKQESKKYLSSKKIIEKENKLFLTTEGKLIADKIASDLFKIN